ncbi:deoxycytidyl transferase [Rhodotorula kratochvilovae]
MAHPGSADDPLDDSDPAFESALASFALPSSPNPRPSASSSKRPPAPEDYRDQAAYDAVSFGEFGRYMRNKRAKLQVQNRDLVEQAKGVPQIFHGLRVYINGYTEGVTLPELQNLLILHGGTYVPYLDQKALVTHIIASNLTPSKRLEFKDYKVATLDWLVDSAREGRLLDWREYSLLAPPKSAAPLALPQGTAAAAGARAAEDAARLGTQTGQRSLFSMGVGKAKDVEPPARSVPSMALLSSADNPLNDSDPAFDSALASFALPPSPDSRPSDSSAKRPPAPEDYRDQAAYNPVGFGELGRFMRNKRVKLQVQNRDRVEHADEGPQIFQGLRVYINGYTDGVTLPELQNLIILHGGTYVPYLDQKALVTHIIASNLTPSKRLEFKDYKVATPGWLVDSARESRLLDWREYSLLAPPKSAVLSAAPQGTAAAGARRAEDAARLGAQTGQRSLFSMGVEKGNDAAAAGESVVEGRARMTETRESLAERGARLAREALEAQAAVGPSGLNAFFAPRGGAGSSASSRPPSRPTTPTKKKLVAGEAPDLFSTPERIAAHLPATTDSAEKPNPVTNSWLPQAQRSDRQNALLSDQDWIMKHTSSSPDFLQGYFAQSRLHWISTFKEELKLRAAAAQQVVPPRKKRLTGRASDGRTIFHIDFDCFFVSAGLTTRPELRGKPVAVCHSRGSTDAASSTSEIASCSYEARACGVRNGMSLGRARELCAEIQTIPFEFELYKSISTSFYDILLKHASFLQAVSIDEVLMEVKVEPTILREHDPALERAEQLRAEILAATGCQASIGISHNILLARLATRKAKPAGAYHLFAEEVDDFMAPLDVDELPGIGWSSREKLKLQLGVNTVGDLRAVPPYKLASVLGPENGKKFAAFAQGVDDRELEVGKARQSVSTEVNYGIRFPAERHDLVERFVRELGAETAKRLREQGLQARQLTLKVMQRHPDAPLEAPKLLGHGWCTTENKVSTLAGRNGGAEDNGDVVGETAWKLMRALQAPPHELRGIGIQLSKLEKDGVPVDLVMEKGQSRLSFKAGPRPAAASTSRASPPPAPPAPRAASPGPPQRTSSTETITISTSPTEKDPPARQSAPAPLARPLRKEPSAIILDDTDSDDDLRASAPALVAPLAPLRKKKGRTPEPHIPFMFRQTKRTVAPPPPTASQVTDAELVYYGIDPDVYHSLDRTLRTEVLADARRKKPAPSAAMLRAKATTPVGSEMPEDVTLPAPKKAPPEVIVLPPSPSEMTDAQITAMEYDPDMFRELGKATQLEQIELHRNRQARLVVGNRSKRAGSAGAAHGGASGSRPRAPVKDVSVRQPPRFQGKAEIEDVEDRLEAWVRVARDAAPDADDLDALGRFVEKCAARDKGHDLKKAVDVLAWWSAVLEAEVGRRGERDGAAALWWEGYARVRERLEWLVLQETGCRLKM